MLSAECKQCLADRCRNFRINNPGYKKNWRTQNPELDAVYQWRGALKRKYGLSEADYKLLLEKQCGLCAICKKPFTKTPNVDHCHITGLVRGLTCRACNRGLGMFHDDPALLLNALQYMVFHEADKIRTNS